MSDFINNTVEALTAKIGAGDFDSTLKFDIEGEGCIRIDDSGISADDSDASCTVSCDRDTFEGMVSGDVNPTAAFMGGKLKVDGDMSVAMKLGSLFG